MSESPPPPPPDQPPPPDLPASDGQDDGPVDAADGLTSRQSKAIDALLAEPTLVRAATLAGVNERTLRRWLTEPVFRTAMFRARREAFGQAVGLTQKYAPVAVATLVKVMNDAGATSSAKVTSAATLLKFGREGIELDDVAERLDRLEQAVKTGVLA